MGLAAGISVQESPIVDIIYPAACFYTDIGTDRKIALGVEIASPDYSTACQCEARGEFEARQPQRGMTGWRAANHWSGSGSLSRFLGWLLIHSKMSRRWAKESRSSFWHIAIKPAPVQSRTGDAATSDIRNGEKMHGTKTEPWLWIAKMALRCRFGFTPHAAG